MEFIQDCKNLPTKSYDRLGCIGIFGALGGALIDYGFQVATNYIKGKEEPWTDIDWGSVTTSAALGAVGVPGALKQEPKYIKIFKVD